MISGSIDMKIRKLEFEEINHSRKKEETIEKVEKFRESNNQTIRSAMGLN